jgi:hypothetical protein
MKTIAAETETRPPADWLPSDDAEGPVYLTRGGKVRFVVVPFREEVDGTLAIKEKGQRAMLVAASAEGIREGAARPLGRVDARLDDEDGINVRGGPLTIFLAWEQLRLVYNGVLAAPTFLVLLWLNDWFDPHLWWHVGGGAILANLCFCAGPVAEGYLSWAGFGGRWTRWVLFVLGTLFALALTAAEMLRWIVGAY